MPLSNKISQYFRKNNHIIIHYHIFKNAGATVDAILRNNFGEACAEYEGSELAAVVKPESMLKYILENPHLKVISSHNARLPVPKHLRLTFYPLIFLRHPIDRIGSMYSFERRQPGGITFTADFARENSFAVRGVGHSCDARLSIAQCVSSFNRKPEARAVPRDSNARASGLRLNEPKATARVVCVLYRTLHPACKHRGGGLQSSVWSFKNSSSK